MVNRREWLGLDLDWHPQVRHAVEIIMGWYERREGAVVLSGGYGCGKTHIAREIYQAYGGPVITLPDTLPVDGHIESVENSVFYSEAKLLDDIRASYNGGAGRESEIIRRCQRCKLLIFDDLGTAHIRQDEVKDSLPWAQEKYWTILEARCAGNKPILLTTNLQMADLFARIGPRATDRLIGLLGNRENWVDMFDVPSYRKRGW